MGSGKIKPFWMFLYRIESGLVSLVFIYYHFMVPKYVFTLAMQIKVSEQADQNFPSNTPDCFFGTQL